MVNLRSCFQIRGHVTIDLMDGDRLIERLEHKNLTVNGGYDIISKKLTESATDTERVTHIAVGTGGHVPDDVTTPVPPAVTDTQLEEEAARAQVYLYEHPSNAVSKFRTTINNDVALGYITEAGLFCENGVMFARVTFPGIQKLFPFYLIVTWEMTVSEGAQS